jgi:hypothetical protein
MIDLYIFSCQFPHNLLAAVKHLQWKVGIADGHENEMQGKSDKILPGDFGCFYDSFYDSALTVPFVFGSEVSRCDDDTPFEFGGPYKFQFDLIPLGPVSLRVPKDKLPENVKKYVSPRCAFVPCSMDESQWSEILESLTPFTKERIGGMRRLGLNGLIAFLGAG